jgi:hypothetical protein
MTEILEKIRHSGKKSLPNALLMHFIQDARDERSVTGEEPHTISLIRDAMGHHATGYKNALKEENTKEANNHAKMYVKYGHLADKISREDPGLVDFSAVPLQPWQKTSPNYIKHNNYPNWDSHRKFNSEEGFSWLQNNPHPSTAKEIESMPYGKDEKGNKLYHNGSYPLEHAKINNKFIPLDKNPTPGEGHIMDSHPILNSFVYPDKEVDENRINQYHKSLHKFIKDPFIKSKIKEHLTGEVSKPEPKVSTPKSEPKSEPKPEPKPEEHSVEDLSSWLHSIK